MISRYKFSNRAERRKTAARLPKLRGMFICPGPLTKRSTSSLANSVSDLFDLHEERFLEPRTMKNEQHGAGPLFKEDEDQSFFGI